MKAFDTENSVWARFSPEQRGQMETYSIHYRQFLDTARTERLANKEIIRQAENAGFRPLSDFTSLKAGDKVYWDQKGKSVILAVIGSDPIEKGLKIVGSHIDCPRLDVKAMPVVEKNKIVYFKTHYYGGLLKYQWVCLPLSLVGVVYKADGSRVDVSIGEDPGDPVLFINDLLPHLGKDQAAKKLSEAISGEMLMPLAGTNGEGEKTKPAILTLLKDKYGIEEEDFTSAELEIIPAVKSRDVGLDRSMIMSHGHDDRVCSYANLAAILDAEPGENTQVALFADKEEIGSVGNTGVQSSYFPDFIAELLSLQVMTKKSGCAGPCATAKSCRPTSAPPSTRSLPMPMKNRTRPSSAMASACANTPVPAARQAATTLTPNSWPRYVASSTKKKFPGRSGNWVKSTKAAVAPSPTSWPTGAATSSTAA